MMKFRRAFLILLLLQPTTSGRAFDCNVNGWLRFSVREALIATAITALALRALYPPIRNLTNSAQGTNIAQLPISAVLESDDLEGAFHDLGQNEITRANFNPNRIPNIQRLLKAKATESAQVRQLLERLGAPVDNTANFQSYVFGPQIPPNRLFQHPRRQFITAPPFVERRHRTAAILGIIFLEEAKVAPEMKAEQFVDGLLQRY